MTLSVFKRVNIDNVFTENDKQNEFECTRARSLRALDFLVSVR